MFYRSSHTFCRESVIFCVVIYESLSIFMLNVYTQWLAAHYTKDYRIRDSYLNFWPLCSFHPTAPCLFNHNTPSYY